MTGPTAQGHPDCRQPTFHAAETLPGRCHVLSVSDADPATSRSNTADLDMWAVAQSTLESLRSVLYELWVAAMATGDREDIARLVEASNALRRAAGALDRESSLTIRGTDQRPIVRPPLLSSS